VYQIGGRYDIETGLLLHRELVKVDSLHLVSTSSFLFICTPIVDHGQDAETAYSHNRVVPRHSARTPSIDHSMKRSASMYLMPSSQEPASAV
jgi:hypothetical protein